MNWPITFTWVTQHQINSESDLEPDGKDTESIDDEERSAVKKRRKGNFI